MSIYLRGGIWWMDVRVGGSRRRVRKSTGCRDEVQARIIEQAAVAVNRGITTRARARAIVDAVTPDESMALDGIAAWYAATAAAERAVPSKLEMQKRMSAVGKAVAWMKANTRAACADDVSDELAWQYACWFEKERKCTVKTRNGQVGQLHTVWEMLIKHGKAEGNPWKRARGVRQVDQEDHGRAFTPDEVERILAAAREVGCEWEGVVTVALYTGLRKRDVETLRWDEVDLGRRVIRKVPSKTARRGIRVTIPMHEAVYRVLSDAERNRGDGVLAEAAAARGSGGEDGTDGATPRTPEERERRGTDGAEPRTPEEREEWVFPWRATHPNGQRPKDGDRFFAEVLAKAGIEEKEGERISFHCLRHTFVTRLSEAGVAQDVRMRLAGHTNAATSNAYTHDDASARAAIDALE